jgi:hypothetical protein
MDYSRRPARHKAWAFGDAIWQGFMRLFEEALRATAPRSQVERARGIRHTGKVGRVPESDSRRSD